MKTVFFLKFHSSKASHHSIRYEFYTVVVRNTKARQVAPVKVRLKERWEAVI